MSKRRSKEGGYVIAMTALLLVPMLVFAAFVTDVGAWYVQGQQIQRAADAAALAAVVWMPDQAAAEKAALEIAALNGFTDQTPGGVDNDPNNITSLADFDDPNAPMPQVKVTALANQQVMVEIRAEGDVYFGSAAGVDDIDITRFAAAEYILPVPMGNPTSALGTADLSIGGGQNFWLNAHAGCFNASAGDLLNSAPAPGSSSPCSSPSNPYYTNRGYTYVVNKPANVAVTVQALHAGRCKRPGWPDDRGEKWTDNTPNLEFSLYKADNTPLSDEDNIVPSNQFLTTVTVNGGPSSGSSPGSTGVNCPTFNANGSWNNPKWKTLFTIPSTAPAGRWFLTVGTPEGSTGHKNMYGLRLLGSNFTGPDFCSTLIPSTVTTGTCPTINALDRFGIYIGENRNTPSTSPEAANFYFAEIDPVHAGKTMEISLWDAAEGSQYLQFLNPQGVAQSFRYRSSNIDGSSQTAWNTISSCPIGGSSGPCLPTPSNVFASKFLTIEIALPQAYTCNGVDCWWKVRYASTTSVDDSTTWSVRITGDPVHLIE